MATNIMKLFSPKIVAQTGQKCTASVILLHGSGGTGLDVHNTFKLLLREDLTFPHIRVIYPTAPLRPYTLSGGLPANVWFDRISLGLDEPEEKESVNSMSVLLGQLIDHEVQSGIPLGRIVIGGFSMGGAMSLHMSYRFYPELAGVLVMSSFLYNDSQVYQALRERKEGSRLPPLRQFHGDVDDLVRYEWGKETHKKLTSLGVQGEFTTIPKLSHSLNSTLAKAARDWIAKVLPE